MTENFVAGELVIPGTYIRVRAEGLIGVGGISTGNIGIVGTSASGHDSTHILGDYESAVTALGEYDANDTAALNLVRAIEQLFRNGARTVFARGVAAGANQAAFTAAFNELVKDDVNILVAPELSSADALAVLQPVLETSETAGKDMMAVVGADGADVAAVTAQIVDNDRIIMSAPGYLAFDAAGEANVNLSATYSAAAVAGLLSTLSPHSSPTNKPLAGVLKLNTRYSAAETRTLVSGRVMVLQQSGDVRVVRGLTSHSGAFTQVTTRRITDFAKAGIRKASNPFIGKLNNIRVRKALQGSIDGFLTTMLQDEMLTGYELEVTATRDDEINGRAIVRAVIQPTFSIDFVAVTLVLQ